MDLKRSGATPSATGPAEWFTGAVRLDPLFAALPLKRNRLAIREAVCVNVPRIRDNLWLSLKLFPACPR